MNDDIVSYASDIGFQNFLINTIEDKNIFGDIIFKDFGMIVILLEKLQNIPGVSDVVYNGATSSIEFCTDYDTFIAATNTPLDKPIGEIVADIVSFAIQNMIVDLENPLNPTELGQSLITRKCTTKNLSYADGYRWLWLYVGRPELLKCFFKTFLTTEPKYMMPNDPDKKPIFRSTVKF